MRGRTFEELPRELRSWIEEKFDPELEASWRSDDPEFQVHRGYDGLIRAYADWMEESDEYYFVPDEFIDAGDEGSPRTSSGRDRDTVPKSSRIALWSSPFGMAGSCACGSTKTKEEAFEAVASAK